MSPTSIEERQMRWRWFNFLAAEFDLVAAPLKSLFRVCDLAD